MIPKQYHIDVRTDNTRFIKQSVDELVFTLMMSALLTSIVCYLFLGSWTSTLNVLLAIPTSIIGAFIGLLFLWFHSQYFHYVGVKLSYRDRRRDAIMMLENIVRHRELGRKRKKRPSTVLKKSLLPQWPQPSP